MDNEPDNTPADGPAANAKAPPVNPNPRPSPDSGLPPPVEFQWRPGISPNPGGQPKGKRVSTRMAEMRDWTVEELDKLLADKTATVRDHMAAKAIKRSMRDEDGNQDLNTVMDRTEGKVAQDFNVRAAPTLTPEQVADQMKNAGLIEGGPGKDEF